MFKKAVFFFITGNSNLLPASWLAINCEQRHSFWFQNDWNTILPLYCDHTRAIGDLQQHGLVFQEYTTRLQPIFRRKSWNFNSQRIAVSNQIHERNDYKFGIWIEDRSILSFDIKRGIEKYCWFSLLWKIFMQESKCRFWNNWEFEPTLWIWIDERWYVRNNGKYCAAYQKEST